MPTNDQAYMWAVDNPGDFTMVFFADREGEHAVVESRMRDEAARDAATAFGSGELPDGAVRLYCTLPEDVERAVAAIGAQNGRSEPVVRRGRIVFLAVGGGATPATIGTGGTPERPRPVPRHVVGAPGDDQPRMLRFTHACERCGELLGRINRLPTDTVGIDTRELQCRCHGIACRYCETGRVRRPQSEHVDAERRVGHMPWFGDLVPCVSCQVDRRGPEVVLSA